MCVCVCVGGDGGGGERVLMNMAEWLWATRPTRDDTNNALCRFKKKALFKHFANHVWAPCGETCHI